MKKKLAIAFLLLLATAVYAQDKVMQQKLETGFVMFDRDKDNALNELEFKELGEYSPKLKGKPQVVDYLFGVLDSNHDSKLSRDEFMRITSVGSGNMNLSNSTATKAESTQRLEPTLGNEDATFFEKKIRPVLVEQCYRCHSANSEDVGGGLLLDTREGIRRGGGSGPGILPGNIDKSLVIEAIRYTNKDLQMPPAKEGGKLPDSIIADFEKWVMSGASDPRDGQTPEAKPSWDMEKAKSHWSYQAIVSPAIPQVNNSAWPRAEVDHFVLANLEAKGISPVGDASSETLVRRIYFDLIGLPPTPEEAQQFLQSHRDDPQVAAKQLVDTLLASPRFGERWGRHWLDVARYAESTGKDVNLLMPHNWRYRDYVIESMNQDKPIKEFFREQIAGDLIQAKDDRDRAMKQIATGFLAIGTRSLNERNAKQFALDTADEQIDTVSQAMLGITVACARCHDHKFDPIPQRDYYALSGIFLSTETCYGTSSTFQNTRAAPLIELSENSNLPRMPNRLSSQRRSELEKELTKIERYGTVQFYGTGIAAKLTGKAFNINNDPKKLVMFVGINAKIGEIRTELNTYEANGNQKLLAVGVRDYPPTLRDPLPEKPKTIGDAFEMYSGRPNQFRMISDSPLYLRGDVDKAGEKVPRGMLSMIAFEPSTIPSTQSGRLELADWIVSSKNPLASRVFVNRVWHWLFGKGIVDSVDNFGTTGQVPSNQALLDYLSIYLQKNNWSMKALIREIVLSRSYQLASTYNDQCFEVDPENALIWRMSPRRLDAECIRDALLAISDELQINPPVGSLVAQRGDAAIGGYPIKSLRAPLSDELFLSADTKCRSVYLPVSRNAVPDSLTVFDFSEPNSVNGSREVTTVPSQALFLLNNEFVTDASRRFAERILKLEPSQRIAMAFQLAYTRSPSESEMKTLKQFFADYPNRDNDLATWTSFCRALIGSAEFRSID